LYGDPDKTNIKNDFVTNCRNEFFSVDQIIFGLQHGFIKSSTLSEDVKIRVEAELIKRHPEIKTK